MRLLSLSLCSCVFVLACEPGPGPELGDEPSPEGFDYDLTGGIDVATGAIGLRHTGATAVLNMGLGPSPQTACEYGEGNGFGDDYVDEDGGNGGVDVQHVHGEGHAVLLRLADGFHVVDAASPGGGVTPTIEVARDWALDAPLEGRFVASGMVALAGSQLDCRVAWSAGGEIEVPGSLCRGDVSVAADPQTGALFASDPRGGLFRIVPDEAVRIAPAHGAIRWDKGLGLLYAVSIDGSSVSALSDDGSVLWERLSADAILAHTDLGFAGAVVVANRAEQMAWFTVVDGASGETLGAFGSPTSVVGLEASGDGSTLAVIRNHAVQIVTLSY